MGGALREGGVAIPMGCTAAEEGAFLGLLVSQASPTPPCCSSMGGKCWGVHVEIPQLSGHHRETEAR